MLAACYLVFNEAQFLRQSIGSLVNGVDRVIVVEGAWPAMPSASNRSSDGTLEILEQLSWAFPGKLQVVQPPQRLTEVEARNLCLSYLGPGDWWLQVDGDEIAEGDLASGLRQALSSAAALFGVKMIEDSRSYWRPKLFRYEIGLHYAEDGPLRLMAISKPPPYPVLEAFWFHHYFRQRDAARFAIREQCYRRGGATSHIALVA